MCAILLFLEYVEAICHANTSSLKLDLCIHEVLKHGVCEDVESKMAVQTAGN